MINVEGMSEGTYDIRLKVPNTLTELLSNVSLSESASIDFGVLRVGDFNNDGIVNLGDFSFIHQVQFWRVEPGNPIYDLNGDGQVNLGDFSYMHQTQFWRQQNH